MAVTQITGGVKENVLPKEATATINFRLLPGDTIEDVVHHVRSRIDDPDIIVRELRPGRVSSRVSDSSSPSFNALHETIRKIFPDVLVAPSMVLGGTDTKHYEQISDNNYRFLPLRLRSEDLKRIHGIDERIALDNYSEIIRFYGELIRIAASTFEMKTQK